MGDHADDLALQESGLDRVPDGTFYVYRYKGKKYSFRTVKEANKWASRKGFRLSTKPPRKELRQSERSE